MPDLISGKNKHMNADDRLEIQQCLDRGMTFKAIAQRIGKGQTTVSKEVKKHLYTVYLPIQSAFDLQNQIPVFDR